MCTQSLEFDSFCRAEIYGLTLYAVDHNQNESCPATSIPLHGFSVLTKDVMNKRNN